MKTRTLCTISTLLLLISISAFSQKEIIYKQVDSVSLSMVVYSPSLMPNKKYPAMVFFFGGGWNGGSITQFEPHAKYFAQRGIVCFLADYRVKQRQGTSPFESLKDAKSAMRFIREEADRFQVDPSKIIASGGSAGGHLAAATALITDYNEESDDLSVSALPNALVLFNPVIDNGPGGYGFERIGEAFASFSPLHNIREGAPPTLLFLGTNDHLIPVETARYYQTVMERVGSECLLHLYGGRGHGFFNYKNFEDYQSTILATDEFLQSLNYLTAEPEVRIE